MKLGQEQRVRGLRGRSEQVLLLQARSTRGLLARLGARAASPQPQRATPPAETKKSTSAEGPPTPEVGGAHGSESREALAAAAVAARSALFAAACPRSAEA